MYQAAITWSDGSKTYVELQQRALPDGVELTLPAAAIDRPAETVDFLENHAPAREGEDGYIAVNNNLIHFVNHEDALYNAGYCTMHFYGVKTPRECFACVVTGLWEQHAILIGREDGVYTAHPRFNLDGQPVPDDMKVELHYLSGTEADYSGMARVYQRYQLENAGCRLLRDRRNEHLDYVLDAPEIRIRLAWKPVPTPVEEQTPETEPPMHIAADFERVAQVLDACRAHGVDKAEFCLVGWNLRGHDGRWPQAFPVEPALGGEDGLRTLIEKAEAMGYRMVCHMNATDCYSIADRWTENLPMRTRDGQKQKNAQWGGGRMYNMCPFAGGEDFMMEDLPRVRELGFRGLHYIDVISCVPPRRCFAPEHPCSQGEFVESMRRIARKSSELYGGFQSEGSYDYLADALDMVLYIDFNLFGRPHPLCDANVPMWQLVYHGIILSNPAPATVNYPAKDWKSRLKFIEYGGHPAIYIHSKFVTSTGGNWMGDDDLTCGSPEEIERTAAAIRSVLDEYQAVKDLQLQRMIRHCTHGETLTETAYEDGTRVFCNYGEEPAWVDDISVAPHDYAVIRV